MDNKEYITPTELKKIMKISLAIDVELGFYFAWHQKTITIDKSDNWNPNKTIMYRIFDNDRQSIFILLNAYAKLFNKRLNLC